MDGFLGTKADFWWDVTLTTETIVVVAFIMAWRYAKRGQGLKHQKGMLTATVMVVGWLFMYVAQQVIAGVSGFDGPEGVKLFIYMPTIIFHSLLSTLAILLSFYQIYGGFKWSKLEGGDKVLSGAGAARHRKLGKVTLLSYLMSVITAYMIYIMLFVIYAPLRVPEYGMSESLGVVTVIVMGVGGIIGLGGVLLARRARVPA
jgi:putative membrane protein